MTQNRRGPLRGPQHVVELAALQSEVSRDEGSDLSQFLLLGSEHALDVLTACCN